MTTPTPGDLSARHWDAIRALLTDYRAALGIIAKHEGPVASKISKEAEEAIAALSALPAAGGTDFASRFTESQARGWKAVCATLDEIDPDWILEGSTSGKTGVQRACDAIRRLATTPQPSAAEEIGPHPLNICPKCKDYYMECECPADAAVGAQGDGAKIADEIMRLVQHGATVDWRPNMAEIAEKVRRLAAPAAGKGVDDVLDLATQYGDHSFGSRNRESWDFDAHGLKQLAAALTRQPVAGDGWRLRRINGGQDDA